MNILVLNGSLKGNERKHDKIHSKSLCKSSGKAQKK